MPCTRFHERCSSKPTLTPPSGREGTTVRVQLTKSSRVGRDTVNARLQARCREIAHEIGISPIPQRAPTECPRSRQPRSHRPSCSRQMTSSKPCSERKPRRAIPRSSEADSRGPPRIPSPLPPSPEDGAFRAPTRGQKLRASQPDLQSVIKAGRSTRRSSMSSTPRRVVAAENKTAARPVADSMEFAHPNDYKRIGSELVSKVPEVAQMSPPPLVHWMGTPSKPKPHRRERGQPKFVVGDELVACLVAAEEEQLCGLETLEDEILARRLAAAEEESARGSLWQTAGPEDPGPSAEEEFQMEFERGLLMDARGFAPYLGGGVRSGFKQQTAVQGERRVEICEGGPVGQRSRGQRLSEDALSRLLEPEPQFAGQQTTPPLPPNPGCVPGIREDQQIALEVALLEEVQGDTTPAVSYTHLRAHETPEHLVCRLLLEKKKNRMPSSA
eukprot:TRINITY_DN32121_c0_g1_i4.p1 TRINITY_DN32121_c0_g1~~TRINITY_DN32121_c0_g1_i4.p1  ORF type:complete len:443 (+),score=50.19 TRINITY_DN32121_c0_g1_i4:250-1578(+)